MNIAYSARRALRRYPLLGILLSVVFVAFLMPAASAATKLKTLYSFCEQENCADGSGPFEGLVEDGSGDLYGTTQQGGINQAGVLFELEFTGSKYRYRRLYNFCPKAGCADGADPNANLILDTNGNLYGTTQSGGSAFNSGTAFELMPNPDRSKWKLITLYVFCTKIDCGDGTQPSGGLSYQGMQTGALYDGTSPLYGTTYRGFPGGADAGIAFELTNVSGKTRRKEKVLVAFCGTDQCSAGIHPKGGLLPDSAGNLYGTTTTDESQSGPGSVYELTPTHDGVTETVLYKFCQLQGCADGKNPAWSLAWGAQGHLFGISSAGGAFSNGAVFEIAPNGAESQESVVYSFCALDACADGASPVRGVTVDSNGDLFGTTFAGGAVNKGIAFKISGKKESVLRSFCSEAACADGANPAGGIILGRTGNLFGTTSSGGANNGGSAFKLTP
jgi:hypothetical protein